MARIEQGTFMQTFFILSLTFLSLTSFANDGFEIDKSNLKSHNIELYADSIDEFPLIDIVIIKFPKLKFKDGVKYKGQNKFNIIFNDDEKALGKLCGLFGYSNHTGWTTNDYSKLDEEFYFFPYIENKSNLNWSIDKSSIAHYHYLLHCNIENQNF